jgi:hypothetical protein
MKPIEDLYIIYLSMIISVSTFIADNQTLTDHIYTNLTESQAKSDLLETFL